MSLRQIYSALETSQNFTSWKASTLTFNLTIVHVSHTDCDQLFTVIFTIVCFLGWFGQVVEQHSTSLHLQWIDGQSDWVNDIVQRSEYRVVESPKTETIIGECR